MITSVALAHLVDATLQSQDGGILIEVHVGSQQPKMAEAARTLVQATVKKANKTASEVFFGWVLVSNVKLQKLSSATSFRVFFTYL